MQFISRIGSLLLLLVSLSSLAQKTLLYQVSGNGLSKNSYIYGTIHAVCPDSAVITGSMREALLKSDALVLEMDESKTGPLKVMKASKMSGDTSLKQLLLPEEVARINRWFESTTGLPFSVFMNFKPLITGSTAMVSLLPCSMREITSYEKQLTQLAKRNKVKIGELESFKEQMHLIDSIPLHLQAKSLLAMADSFDFYRSAFLELTRAHKAADLDWLRKLVEEEVDRDELGIQSLLLNNRNHRWIPRMEEKMKSGSQFFAVGAAHLIGEQGILELLRRAGYTITPLY